MKFISYRKSVKSHSQMKDLNKKLVSEWLAEDALLSERAQKQQPGLTMTCLPLLQVLLDQRLADASFFFKQAEHAAK